MQSLERRHICKSMAVYTYRRNECKGSFQFSKEGISNLVRAIYLGGGHQRAMLVSHRLDIRMWHGVELVEVELIVGANVDVGALVLCAVAITWCREDCGLLAVLPHP